MASLTEKIQQMVNNRCLNAIQQPPAAQPTAAATPNKHFPPSAEFDVHEFDILNGVEDLDFSFFMSEEFDEELPGQKRGTASVSDSDSDQSYTEKRFKLDPCSPADSYDTDHTEFDLPNMLHLDIFPSSEILQASESCHSGLDNLRVPRHKSGTLHSAESSPLSLDSLVPGPVESDTMSAEYHFEQIQKHARLAIAALRRGQYERNKNIVTWAHELKNKIAHEVKREAEAVWDTDREKLDPAALKLSVKKPNLGSTKRVEQFRKNLRRWMTGTQVHQIGVEWMVYARMEHLQAIASYILGGSIPDDPASPTAVAESISKYLGVEMPADFVDSQLAEPEPGKRYVIGQGLIPYLQSRIVRKVPTLAFTMPSDSDTIGLDLWLTNLRALFPKKPAPKVRTVKQ